MKNSNLARTGKQNGMYGSSRTGKSSPFFGRKHSEATKEKIRQTKLGKKQTAESNAKRSLTLKGRQLTDEHKKKIGDAHRGKVVPRESVEKMIKSLTGRKLTLEHRAKLSGVNHPRWKGGITNKNQQLRNTIEFKNWRDAVYKRDNFTCQMCFARGVTLNADHIKSFALYPELRFELSNGRTLCVPCHKTTPNFAGRTNNLARVN